MCWAWPELWTAVPMTGPCPDWTHILVSGRWPGNKHIGGLGKLQRWLSVKRLMSQTEDPILNLQH